MGETPGRPRGEFLDLGVEIQVADAPGRMLGNIQFALHPDQVLKAPAAPGRDEKKINAMVLAMVPDRSQKFQVPEPLRPTNRFGSPEDTRKHFLESRTKTVALLKDTPDLREHAVDNPPLGQKLDAYEWILFIAAHSDRHTQQIKEAEADPKFPKK
jgi:hypothetical protein